MATEAESILPKCAKLFRAGKSFIFRDVSIDWGVPQEALQGGTPASAVRFVDHDAVLRQTPATIETIHPGHRFIVFAFIQLDGFVIPKSITPHRIDQNATIVDLSDEDVRELIAIEFENHTRFCKPYWTGWGNIGFPDLD